MLPLLLPDIEFRRTLAGSSCACSFACWWSCSWSASSSASAGLLVLLLCSTLQPLSCICCCPNESIVASKVNLQSMRCDCDGDCGCGCTSLSVVSMVVSSCCPLANASVAGIGVARAQITTSRRISDSSGRAPSRHIYDVISV